MRNSIVIPTCKEKNLLPCLESIKKYTDLTNTEIIVVANGYDGEIPSYIESRVSFSEKIGYPAAINAGIAASKGDFLTLLNDDTELLEQPVNQWIDILSAPFSDPKMAITGPWMMLNTEIDREFICFFCCMIRRSVLDKIGMLDEIFTPGFGEDVDLSCKAVDAGFKITQVPTQETLPYDGIMGIGQFPIFHSGGRTISMLA